MKAVRLHGARDLRLDEVPAPGPPQPGEVQIKVGAVGICGSDLHMYGTGTIGGIQAEHPFILGHEFMGTVAAVGPGARTESGKELKAGTRVAVEPANPCGHCEVCRAGHPNLCPYHTFHGVYPTDGALCARMNVRATNCFPIPDSISDGSGTLLETLGVALHAVDLGKLRVGHTVAVIGAGPVGLLIARLATLAGAKVFVFDKLSWRTELAARFTGGEAHTITDDEAIAILTKQTNGRGADIVFEAAWADQSIQQAAEMCRYGGRLVLVGIPPDDRFAMQHATARRKGLTIMMARRMKHTYPRAIALTSGEAPQIDLDLLVSETVSLGDTAQAFERNYAYEKGVVKIIIQIA